MRRLSRRRHDRTAQGQRRPSRLEELWARGATSAVFVGRRGWFEEAVVTKFEHEEFGRLLWFTIDDDELFLRSRGGADFPSMRRFRLPIVEAARRGRPVICSDIPVRRSGRRALFSRQ
jgi:hypothetical protein